MKQFLAFLMILSLCLVGCQQRSNNENISVKNKDSKIFEDQTIRAELSVDRIEGKELYVTVIYNNKQQAKISFDAKDFIFKANEQVGRLPTNQLAGRDLEDSRPVWKEMEEIEGENRAIENMKAQMRQFSKLHDQIFSDVMLDSREMVTKNYVIKFDKEINPADLEFFFAGNYKQLLTI